MVTISFTKHQLFLITIALDGYAFEEKYVRTTQMDIVRILSKFRKALRLRSDKAEISIVLDDVQKNIPEKKRPLQVKK